MAHKVVLVASLLGCTHAGVIVARGPAPVVKAVAAAGETDFDPSPQYSYAYDIADSLTGDNKAQQESRDGDVVRGSYSLLEADGSRRTVEYSADPVSGFNAVVHREAAVVAGKAVVAHQPQPQAFAFAAKAPAAVGLAPLHTHAYIG